MLASCSCSQTQSCQNAKIQYRLNLEMKLASGLGYTDLDGFNSGTIMAPWLSIEDLTSFRSSIYGLVLWKP